jgi:hypothetical protein
MVPGHDRSGCPRGWLKEPTYPARVEWERAEAAAGWLPDDWATDSWDGADGLSPE